MASELDRNSLHARKADELVVLEDPRAYLDIDLIIAAAKGAGCDALHPGYGFLSENADFARAVIEAGIVFIGPSAEAIGIMGSKTRAREKVIAAGVPCLPGSEASEDPAEVLRMSDSLRFPLLLKARAGGGGRGMRLLQNKEDLKEQASLAIDEAKRFFGDGEVFLEQYLGSPRHVEVQVLGDQQGNLIQLGTRDCSLQRRHQKVIEEAPAPFLSEKTRRGLHEAALQAARSVNYYSAGTVEFLVQGDEFYFLEMNTRIQVEHPVTEEISGVDLIQEQIRVARGEELSKKQKELRFKGHSIELRVYAEDPENNFAPSPGRISNCRFPSQQPWLRIENGVESRDLISPNYDAMIAKIIVTGKDREDAIKFALAALRETSIEGLKTNLSFLRWACLQSDFSAAPTSIQYLDKDFNASELQAIDKAFILDSNHSADFESEKKEIFSENIAGNHIEIELVHEKSGFFLATARSEAGIENIVRSNGKRAALSTLRKAFS